MVDLPLGQSVVGYRWVYKIKTKVNESVERYKTRLVAKAFIQEYGIDYEETFAHVTRLTSISCSCYSLLASLSNRCEECFLQWRPSIRNVHATTPSYPHSGNQVCCIRCALYGLKQASRVWFENFSSVVTQ